MSDPKPRPTRMEKMINDSESGVLFFAGNRKKNQNVVIMDGDRDTEYEYRTVR